MPLQVSEGYDGVEVNEDVQALCEQGWNVENDIELVKTFYLKTYTKVTVRKRLELQYHT
jgi:hypothetical protein